MLNKLSQLLKRPGKEFNKQSAIDYLAPQLVLLPEDLLDANEDLLISSATILRAHIRNHRLAKYTARALAPFIIADAVLFNGPHLNALLMAATFGFLVRHELSQSEKIGDHKSMTIELLARDKFGRMTNHRLEEFGEFMKTLTEEGPEGIERALAEGRFKNIKFNPNVFEDFAPSRGPKKTFH